MTEILVFYNLSKKVGLQITKQLQKHESDVVWEAPISLPFSILHIPVRVHLWDLSGASEFFDVRNELYSGTDAIFLVFDVTNTSSFEALDQWLREVQRFTTGRPEVFVVGNKVTCNLSLAHFSY